jgi:hypothetical protein
MAFAQTMKARFGSRLAELIYTPMGQGIWQGRPHTFSGSVAAEHFDHVHVAYDSGRPGQGDGIGQATAAAKAAGFKGEALINMIAIAGAESQYNAEAQNLKYPDHSIGMWQINQLAHKGRFGTDQQLMDPFRNARAAKVLFGESGYNPWTTWPSAAAGYIARARAAASGGGGAGGGTPAARTGNRGTVVGGAGGIRVGVPGVGFNQPRAGIPGAYGSSGRLEEELSITALRIAEVGEGTPGAVAPMRRQQRAIGERIAQLREALGRRGVRPSRRAVWRNELAQLLQDSRAIGEQIGDITATPTPGLAAAGLAGAEATLTTGLGDDLAAATTMRDIRAGELTEARKTGDTDAIVDAIDAFRQAEEAVKGFTEQIEAAKPTVQDFSDLRLAEASLTSDLGDDLSALQDRVQKEEADLEAARGTGDPQTIIAAIGELTGAQGALKSLEDQLKANDDAERERQQAEEEARRVEQENRQRLTDAMNSLADQMKAQNEIHEKVARTNTQQAIRALADVISSTQAGSSFRARLASAGSGSGVLIPHG